MTAIPMATTSGAVSESFNAEYEDHVGSNGLRGSRARFCGNRNCCTLTAIGPLSS